MDKENDPTANAGIWEKIKSIKHIRLVAAIALALIAVACVAAFLGGEKESAEVDFESRIAEVLSEIDGVGKCKVMITYDGEGQSEIAYEREEESNVTTDSDGSGDRVVENSNSHSRPVTVIVDGVEQPLVISTSPAPVKGVVVVAQGGGDVMTKLKIIDAVCALVDVKGLAVKVFEMK